MTRGVLKSRHPGVVSLYTAENSISPLRHRARGFCYDFTPFFSQLAVLGLLWLFGQEGDLNEAEARAADRL